MKFDEFKNLVAFLFTEDRKRDELIKNMPSEFRSVFYDSEFVNSLERCNDKLIETVFGDDFNEWVYWIIYEWKPGFAAGINGNDYIINTLDDFFNMIQEHHFPNE